MRCMTRNKQKFCYALYSGKTEITDDDGNFTGEYTDIFGTKTDAYGNISSASGSANRTWYGVVDAYDKVIVLSGTSPITETTALWIDDLDSETADYAVKLISKSLNSTTIIARKI